MIYGMAGEIENYLNDNIEFMLDQVRHEQCMTHQQIGFAVAFLTVKKDLFKNVTENDTTLANIINVYSTHSGTRQ